MRQHLQVLVLCVAAVTATACDESLSKVAGPTPNLAPTFSAIQRDIFEAADSSGRPNCNKCHSTVGRAPSGGLSLDHDVAYSSLVNVASTRKAGATRVIPGDPENSYLVHKIEGRPGIVGGRMPFNGPFLSDGQILILKRWIANGAPNN
jgi:hypothetical protein